MTFQQQIQQGIPSELPQTKPYETQKLITLRKRKEILNEEEKNLALKNALRYFEPKFHAELLPEFREELEKIWQNLYVSFSSRLRKCMQDQFQNIPEIFTGEIYHAHDSK